MPKIPVDLNDYSNADQFCQEYQPLLSNAKNRNRYIQLFNKVLNKHQVLYRDVISETQLKKDILDSEFICQNIGTPRSKHDDLCDGLLNSVTKFRYFVDDNGKWIKLNKLNSNYSACAYVLLHYLYDQCKVNPQLYEEVKLAFQLMERYPNTYIKEWIKILTIDIFNDDNLDNLFDNFIIKNKTEIDKIIEYTSNIGAQSEQHVLQYLMNTGWEIYRTGGDGDIIDQYYKIDIVAISPNKIAKGIQIKTVQSIKPVNIPRLIPNNRFYEVETNSGIASDNPACYNIMVFTSHRGDILGFEQQPKAVKKDNIWEIDTTDLLFPSGDQLLICNHFENLITPNLLSINPDIYD